MANALRDLVLPALDVDRAGEPWPLIRAGIVGSLLLVAGVVIWVWLAPLSGAVIGPGQVKVDMNRKTVQHQEGGIVGEILVRDGSKVKAGQTLILLRDVRVDAGNDAVRTQLDAELAKAARLSAEQTGAAEIDFPAELTQRSSDPRVAELLKHESSVFRVRREALTNQIALLRNQAREARDEIKARQAQLKADAQAIIWLRLSSERHAALEISEYADRYIADRLKTLPGVASVIIGGERRYAMRLWVDRDRLAAYGLTPQDVENGLRKQNVEIPSGRIESSQREFTVLTEADLRSESQFNNMILAESRGYSVRLRDVGVARLGALDERNVVRVNGNPAVGLGVVKQSTANTLSVATAVKEEMARLQKTLPEGMSLAVAFDSSVFIDRSIIAVYRTMLEAVALVVLVIFVFLRSVRSTLIPFVTIPVSLIGAFFFLWLMGFSVNVLTLLGLVLAIGLVVDDAIVVLENCHRHVELGKSPRQASIDGAREIAFAVVAMSLTLAAVFAPLGFMTGNTGRLFTEFALTVAAAVVVSGLVALTLTPMMCSRILKEHESHGRLYQAMERFFAGMTNGYRRSVAFVVVVIVIVVVMTVIHGSGLDSGGFLGHWFRRGFHGRGSGCRHGRSSARSPRRRPRAAARRENGAHASQRSPARLPSARRNPRGTGWRDRSASGSAGAGCARSWPARCGRRRHRFRCRRRRRALPDTGRTRRSR